VHQVGKKTIVLGCTVHKIKKNDSAIRLNNLANLRKSQKLWLLTQWNMEKKKNATGCKSKTLSL